MTRTRQEAADALLETGLDVPSLEAILQAVEIVNRTGWGTISFVMKEHQIVHWEFRQSHQIARQ